MLDAYKNILVAIDGSEKAEKAFMEAVAAAKRNQATLHILYVNEVTGNYFGDFGFLTPNLQEELDEVAEKQMNEHRNLAIDRYRDIYFIWLSKNIDRKLQ